MHYDFSKTPEANRVREAARVSYDAFVDAIGEYARVEWVDGEAEYLGIVTCEHARMCQFVRMVIAYFLDSNPIGELFGSGFQMKLGATFSGRVPDLFFLRNENSHRVREFYLDGPADIVVEVVSPDSVRKDREQKFKEYGASGIPEYWIIDSVRGVSEFYTLPEVASQYEAAALDANGLFHSRQLPGLRINPDWLKKDPLPSVKSVLVEAGIVDSHA